MKEIIAIIRPKKWDETKDKLDEAGVHASTQHRVYGRGRQKGLRSLQPGTKELSGVTYIPKRIIHLLVTEEDVQKCVDTIMAVNRTPAMGDGKIFVCPIEEVIRIRTKETGQLAVI